MLPLKNNLVLFVILNGSEESAVQNEYYQILRSSE